MIQEFWAENGMEKAGWESYELMIFKTGSEEIIIGGVCLMRVAND